MSSASGSSSLTQTVLQTAYSAAFKLLVNSNLASAGTVHSVAASLHLRCIVMLRGTCIEQFKLQCTLRLTSLGTEDLPVWSSIALGLVRSHRDGALSVTLWRAAVVVSSGMRCSSDTSSSPPWVTGSH